MVISKWQCVQAHILPHLDLSEMLRLHRNQKASTVPKQVPHTGQPPGTAPDVETEVHGHTCVLWEGCHSEGAQGDNAPEAKRAVSAVARSAAEPWGNWVCQQAGGYQHAFLIHVTSLNPLMDPTAKNYPYCTGKFTEKQGIKAQRN